MGDLASWFSGTDSGGTLLANIVTILGVLGLVGIALSIQASFEASISLRAELHRSNATLRDGHFRGDIASLPPGDVSRMYYELYMLLQGSAQPWWTGHLAVRRLSALDARAYRAHVGDALALFDAVLRHSPKSARAEWTKTLTPHLFAHGALFKQWVWQLLRWRYARELRKLIAAAPSPKAARQAARASVT